MRTAFQITYGLNSDIKTPLGSFKYMLPVNRSESTMETLAKRLYLGFLRANQIKEKIVLLHTIFGFEENSCQLRAWRQCEVGDTVSQEF